MTLCNVFYSKSCDRFLKTGSAAILEATAASLEKTKPAAEAVPDNVLKTQTSESTGNVKIVRARLKMPEQQGCRKIIFREFQNFDSPCVAKILASPSEKWTKPIQTSQSEALARTWG